jgi:hypothetical protein
VNLSERDRRFLFNVARGEEEWGRGCWGIIARSGGDASTIRSLVRRGLLECMGIVEDGEGRQSPGYTLTDAGRDIVAEGP